MVMNHQKIKRPKISTQIMHPSLSGINKYESI